MSLSKSNLLKTLLTVSLLITVSILLRLFFFRENADRDSAGWGVWAWGVTLASAVWGFCYPQWRKMPYVFLLLIAFLPHVDAGRGILDAIEKGAKMVIYLGLPFCTAFYLIGKGLACGFHAVKSSKPKPLNIFLTICLWIFISAVMWLNYDIFGAVPPVIWFVCVVAWGFRYSWHRMPYVLLMPFYYIYHEGFHPRDGDWSCSVLVLLCICVTAYAAGRVIAWIWQWMKRNSMRNAWKSETEGS